ncbi:MAG: hypothetical protein H6868_04980 [Rhodospirillales bacterium]|nr:hypothetical protein [Rhodospirillales bacterium]
MTEKTPPPVPEYNKGTDRDVNVELVVNDRAEAIVFHNKPFKKKLSWLEFDLDTNKLDLVMNDGDTRSYGIAVDPKLTKYMQNAFQVLMVLMNENTGEPEGGEYFPLILHKA